MTNQELLEKLNELDPFYDYSDNFEDGGRWRRQKQLHEELKEFYKIDTLEFWLSDEGILRELDKHIERMKHHEKEIKEIDSKRNIFFNKK